MLELPHLGQACCCRVYVLKLHLVLAGVCASGADAAGARPLVRRTPQRA